MKKTAAFILALILTAACAFGFAEESAKEAFSAEAFMEALKPYIYEMGVSVKDIEKEMLDKGYEGEFNFGFMGDCYLIDVEGCTIRAIYTDWDKGNGLACMLFEYAVEDNETPWSMDEFDQFYQYFYKIIDGEGDRSGIDEKRFKNDFNPSFITYRTSSTFSAKQKDGSWLVYTVTLVENADQEAMALNVRIEKP